VVGLFLTMRIEQTYILKDDRILI